MELLRFALSGFVNILQPLDLVTAVVHLEQSFQANQSVFRDAFRTEDRMTRSYKENVRKRINRIGKKRSSLFRNIKNKLVSMITH